MTKVLLAGYLAAPSWKKRHKFRIGVIDRIRCDYVAKATAKGRKCRKHGPKLIVANRFLLSVCLFVCVTLAKID
ncbi:hypothetical protein CpipJ_CPIJ014921 [Culex quinquefasciatus]|uniref:Uncharacterized protein n=1 Tax=Culex quinquefasciatus TaxID=7176 RepID=B0X659_CULQU|nr:hypothetical protein CpipJ_CPIJ014921 [Culex quinquefasciatus]|eukprot:XP_001865131.1 hypothetical protein CpipJ_CPIJ014921 [Culex quinquefasciatus]